MLLSIPRTNSVREQKPRTSLEKGYGKLNPAAINIVLNLIHMNHDVKQYFILITLTIFTIWQNEIQRHKPGTRYKI